MSQARSALDDVTSTVMFERVDGGKLGESFLAKYCDYAAEVTHTTMKACVESGGAAPVR